MNAKAGYRKSKDELWNGRIDSPIEKNSLRFHQVINHLDLNKSEETDQLDSNDIVILGYAVEEGVRINQGRVGAANGPDHIRKSLAGLTCHITEQKIYDGGNVYWNTGEIFHVQKLLADLVGQSLKKKCKTIVIGGGHDIAFGHFMGIRQSLPKESKIGIINFDAHFDLRDVENGKAHSGTPFFQISEIQKEEFYYLPVGIRESGNTKNLTLIAEKLCQDTIYLDELYKNDLTNIQVRINRFIKECDYIYLTIDLDGFGQSIAPGVSAPNPTGMSWRMFLPLYELVLASNKVISIDIAECNPIFDLGESTGKLAAEILWRYIHFNIS